MSKYVLSDVKDFDKLNETEDYIILFGVDGIPPHIGFVHNRKYFSKSSQGVKRGHDFYKVLNSIIRKGIATVLIRLKELSLNPEQYFDQTHLSKGESCLTPIKQMLSEADKAVLECKYLFDVVEFLSQNNYIVGMEHLNCSNLINRGNLELMKYTQKEIDLAILQAKRPC